ncbi:DNA primase [Emcibacter sp. SYSU 3D8]|uniref:DNA primase n=1 Tax=Emcibacter sp. SYSU 3D8 TaxID=3133969 RepID=UPI0031FE85DC
MRFTPEFLDELRLRVRLTDVVGRQVKLVRKGRESGGLCPFHNEKTPSFTVNDEKGFYHCFGCGAHGNVIDFVMNTEGLGFPEAVERLAGEAGMALPVWSEGDRAQDDRRKSQHEVMEIAAAWYQSQLAAGIGRGARDYLQQRGLTAETIKTFRLGFAPEARTTFKDAMLARKIDEQLLVDTGMLIRPEDGGASFDRFRDRVMFPITDPQARIVGFGGRALGDAPAKYLNSPETALFHKGKLLYNHALARPAARSADRVVVAEGYMDVIALAQAGLKEAVAPLGTAVTEDQLALLWRMAAEPIFCFDGDSAGLRAAERALLKALPLLKAGQSLRFATLPKGEDPDTLIRNQGVGAMRDVLDRARPLIDVLWDVELARQPVDTPERRAGFKARLRELLGGITDTDVRGFYRDEFDVRTQALWAPRRFERQEFRGKGKGRRDFQPPVSRELLATPLARGAGFTNHRRERLILLTMLNHPGLIEVHHEELMAVDMDSVELDKLRAAIIRIAASCHHSDDKLESSTIRNHLYGEGFGMAVQRLEGDKGLVGDSFARPDATADSAEQGLRALLRASQLQLLQHELEAAEVDAMSDDSVEAERATHRARDIRAQIEALMESLSGMDQ